MFASLFNSDAEARRTGCLALAVLLLFWGLFSAAHLLQTRGFLASDLWLLSKDGGHAEYFEYTLLLVSSAAFLRLFLRFHEFLHLAVAVILLYLTADNALGLHEAAGCFYEDAKLASPIHRVRPAHFGEFLYLGVVGFALLAALLLAARNAERAARNTAWIVGALIFSIGLFSAVIDTASDWLASSQLSYLDDSGELFVIVLLAAYSIFLTAKHRTARRAPSSASP